MDKARTVAPLVLLALLLDTLTSGLITPVLLNLIGYQHISELNVISSLAFLLSLSPIYFFATPILGAYSDYRRRKPVVIFCLCAACSGYCLTLLANLSDIKVITLLAVVLFCIANGALPIYQAMIADTDRSKRCIYYLGLLVLVLNLSPLASQVSAYLLNHAAPHYNKTNYTLTTTALLLQLVNLTIIYRYLPETNDHTSATNNGASVLEYILSAYDVVLTKPIILLLILTAIFNTVLGIYLQHTPIHLAAFLGWKQHAIVTLNSVQILAIIVGFIVIFPLLLRYLNTYRLILVGFISALIAFLLNDAADYWDNNVLMWLTHGAIVSYLILVLPCLWYQLIIHATRRFMGLVLGMTTVIWAIAWMSSGLIATNITARTHDAVWHIFVGFILIAIILIVRYREIIFE